MKNLATLTAEVAITICVISYTVMMVGGAA